MLSKLADIYDEEVARTTARLLALLVPALTIGMGVMIAGIIMLPRVSSHLPNQVFIIRVGLPVLEDIVSLIESAGIILKLIQRIFYHHLAMMKGL